MEQQIIISNQRIIHQGIPMIGQTPYASLPDGPTCKKIQNYIFKFSDLLGQGNFSKVYKAHHQITDDIVAIKIIELNSLKSKKLQQLLFSEINVLKKLNHPNVLRCFEVFTSNRNCYIITELCNQGDLESKLRRRHHFTQESAEPIILDIFKGLLYLAEQNIIHRDLKVANVFMHNGKAKLADFGFAKFTNNKFKDINIGSPIYMSPEGFIDNVYGPKTDIWAFGVLIYQLLHGQTPFNFCKTESQLKYNLSLPFNRNKIRSEISQQLKEVIMRCMQIDESKRVTAFELASMPFFQKLLKISSTTSATGLNLTKTQLSPYYQNYNSTPSHKGTDYRIRSPSYQGQNYNSTTLTNHNNHNNINNNTSSSHNNPSSSQKNHYSYKEYNIGQQKQNQFINHSNRRISTDTRQRDNNFLSVHQNSTNSPSVQFNRGHSPLNGFVGTNKVKNYQTTHSKRENYFSTRNLDAVEFGHKKTQPQDLVERRRQRGLTTDKRTGAMRTSTKSIEKREGLHLISNTRAPKVISHRLTFKQTVNILHYARLIFKYIQLLKEQAQQNVKQIHILTKWVMTILDEVAEKIENKQISFEGGTNPEIREKKLIEVTSEYQKKYRKELQDYLIEINLKDTVGILNLQVMKDHFYSEYLKYDHLILEEFSKNVIFLGHNIMMMYQATRLIKKCYDQRNYWLLENYKDIQLFLSKSKDTVDMDSYHQKRKGMTIYR